MHYLWLCPICLVLAAIFIGIEKSERYVAADVIKGIASLVFVILGFLCAGEASVNADPVYINYILAGLVVGAVADVVLNLRYVFEGNRGKLAFLVGIAVFMVGHILYLLAVLRVCSMPLLFVGIGLVLTGALMMWIFQRIDAAPAFKVLGVFYVGAITVMNSVALGALITNPTTHSGMFLVGALLFLLSDVILILNTFGSEKRFSRRVANLMLYYIAQLLIALSLQLL